MKSPKKSKGKQVGIKSRKEKAAGTSIRSDRCLKQEAEISGRESMALNAKPFFPWNSSPALLLTEVRQSGALHLLVVRGRCWGVAFSGPPSSPAHGR